MKKQNINYAAVGCVAYEERISESKHSKCARIECSHLCFTLKPLNTRHSSGSLILLRQSVVHLCTVFNVRDVRFVSSVRWNNCRPVKWQKQVKWRITNVNATNASNELKNKTKTIFKFSVCILFEWLAARVRYYFVESEAEWIESKSAFVHLISELVIISLCICFCLMHRRKFNHKVNRIRLWSKRECNFRILRCVIFMWRWQMKQWTWTKKRKHGKVQMKRLDLLCSSDTKIERLTLRAEHLWTWIVWTWCWLWTSVVSLAIVIRSVWKASCPGTTSQRSHTRCRQINDRSAWRRCIATKSILMLLTRCSAAVFTRAIGDWCCILTICWCSAAWKQARRRRCRRSRQCWARNMKCIAASVHASWWRCVVEQFHWSCKTVALQIIMFALVDANGQWCRLMMMCIQIVLCVKLWIQVMMMMIATAIWRCQIIRIMVNWWCRHGRQSTGRSQHVQLTILIDQRFKCWTARVCATRQW